MGNARSAVKDVPTPTFANKAAVTRLSKTGSVSVKINDLRQNIFDALRIQGHSEEDGNIITDVLMFAELRANNQGIVKLISGDQRQVDSCIDRNTYSMLPIKANPHQIYNKSPRRTETFC